MNMRSCLWYILYCLLTYTASANSETSHIPQANPNLRHSPNPKAGPQSKFKRHPSPCPGNTPTTRQQWCEHNLYTDYTTTFPETGVTREFWLDVGQATVSPDGRPRWALTINGTLPGPTIEVNWGDTVVIHLRNNLPRTVKNGTSLHIHGLRQHYTNPMDGVVSVTQCPLAPGHSMTYRWRATQYGTTWYHSHIGLQTWEGVYGGVIIHGPASSNYDEDKGILLLSDWDINTVDQLWNYAETKGSPRLDNALINGVNVFGDDGDPGQTGHRFNISFTPGKVYRLRITNVACDTQFKFSIDHHTLTVIAIDFVPIQPYNTIAISVSIGQRYDVTVHADQNSVAKAFWLRATPQLACSSNSNADNIRGIILYENTTDASRSTGTAIIPMTTAYALTDSCEDEAASKLIPIISQGLRLTASDFYYEDLPVSAALTENSVNSVYRWYLNGTSMHVKWSQPTLLEMIGARVQPDHIREKLAACNSSQETRAVVAIPKADTWVIVEIETIMPFPHPIHLHGHDFLIVSQGIGSWNGKPETHQLDFAAGALPKRDTALLPALGHLVLAFRTDNPGAWLMHCHIGWHLDQGFALQFVERGSEIRGLFNGETGLGGDWMKDARSIKANCDTWNWYNSGGKIFENGAGI